MSWHEDRRREYDEYEKAPKHQAHISHELIGGAAAFEAVKAYEDHVAKNGHPDSHAKAKEIIAGLVGVFIDREVETKGLDFLDREKAKRHAREHANDHIQTNPQYNRWN